MQPQPIIITTADDYAYCPQRSRGILELLQHGHIGSVSVMVNAPNCEGLLLKLGEVVDRVRVSVGLHVNLTEFQPVSGIGEGCRDMVEAETGGFKGKAHIFSHVDTIEDSPALQQWLATEIQAQVDKFTLIMKQKPTHLDGHNHVHVVPWIAQATAEVGRLNGIYKVRMPQVMLGKLQATSPQVDEFNNRLQQLMQQSKGIYDHYGFVYADWLIGLDCMGHNFTVDTVQSRVRDIIANTPQSKLSTTVIQVMCHPGYKQIVPFPQHPTCPFSQHPAREHQLQVLQSQAYHQLTCPSGSPASYHSLRTNKCEKSVLIYSKLVCGSGNLTTALRIGGIMGDSMGFRVYYMSEPSAVECTAEVGKVRRFLRDFGVGLVLGINLTRTASTIYRATNQPQQESQYPTLHQNFAYKVPYFLVIAGTDMNITLKQGYNPTDCDNNNCNKSVEQIITAIRHCLCLISLSADMKLKMQHFLCLHNIQKQTALIPQSTINLNQPLLQPASVAIPNRPYIIFPSSFRKVKCIQHLLPELNALIDTHNLEVLLLGPVLNHEYYQSLLPQLQRVQYLGCLPHDQYLRLLNHASLLINTSQSEGMSCAVLEAFAAGVPVIVRGNEGNCELVEDGTNGLVYQQPGEFLVKFQQLWGDGQLRDRLVTEGRRRLGERYGYEREVSEYAQCVDKYYGAMVHSLQLEGGLQLQSILKGSRSLPLLTLPSVHPIQPTNNTIFHKFFSPDSNSFTPAHYYLPHLLSPSSQINILDMGAGTGIFTIIFVLDLIKYLKQRKQSAGAIGLRLWLVDIDEMSLANLSINMNKFVALLAQLKSTQVYIKQVKILRSNMFEQVPATMKFHIILANLPQAPFLNPRSRRDKNGGHDGTLLMQALLRSYPQHLASKHSLLLILYSYIGDPHRFASMLEQYGSRVEWRSGAEVHRGRRGELEGMEEGMAGRVEQRMRDNKAEIVLEEDVFYIPADLRLIRASTVLQSQIQ